MNCFIVYQFTDSIDKGVEEFQNDHRTMDQIQVNSKEISYKKSSKYKKFVISKDWPKTLHKSLRNTVFSRRST